MRRIRRQSGFTLIERLVVIITIGILAAIAIPVYMHQRERAKDAAVEDGTHNIELGLGTHAIDHADLYPAALAGSALLASDDGSPCVDNWPAIPWSGAGMTHGGNPGDCTHVQTGSETGFILAGHMSTGDFVIP